MGENAPSWKLVGALVALVAGLVAAGCNGSGSDAASKASALVAAATTTTPGTTIPPTTTSLASTTTQATTTTAATTTTTAAPAPCAVSYVGDSLGMGTLRNGLPQALASVGCKLVWNAAYGGMETSVGAQLLTKNAGQPSNVALVMLGYHNARAEVSRGMFPGLIDQVMKGAGDRTVVWPLLWYTSDCSAGYKQAVVRANQELHAAQVRWPNLLLADYPTFVMPHPEYSENRCPHLLPPGYHATATWLANEVRRLIDERGADPASTATTAPTATAPHATGTTTTAPGAAGPTSPAATTAATATTSTTEKGTTATSAG